MAKNKSRKPKKGNKSRKPSKLKNLLAFLGVGKKVNQVRDTRSIPSTKRKGPRRPMHFAKTNSKKA